MLYNKGISHSTHRSCSLLRNSIRKYKTLGKQVAQLEIKVRFRFDTLEFLNKKSKKKDEMI